MNAPDRLALVTYLSLFYELFQDTKPAILQAGSVNSVETTNTSKRPAVCTNEPPPSKEPLEKKTNKKKSALTVKPVEKKLTSSSLKGAGFSEQQSTHPSNELQVASTKKDAEAQPTSAVKQVTSPGEQAASADKKKPGISIDKPVSSADKQVTSPVESPVKKKKTKRKFRLFRRRNKKKSLATATPSVER